MSFYAHFAKGSWLTLALSLRKKGKRKRKAQTNIQTSALDLEQTHQTRQPIVSLPGTLRPPWMKPLNPFQITEVAGKHIHSSSYCITVDFSCWRHDSQELSRSGCVSVYRFQGTLLSASVDTDAAPFTWSMLAIILLSRGTRLTVSPFGIPSIFLKGYEGTAACPASVQLRSFRHNSGSLWPRERKRWRRTEICYQQLCNAISGSIILPSFIIVCP